MSTRRFDRSRRALIPRTAAPPTSLNPKQVLFCLEYLRDLNATEAALRAGYSKKTAYAQGSDLLKHPEICQYIQGQMDLRAGRVLVNADDVLREILRIATADIAAAFDADGKLRPLDEIPEDTRRAIAGVEILEEWGGAGESRSLIGYTKKIKFWDKVRALELLGKHLRLFGTGEDGDSPVNIHTVNIVYATRR